MATAAMTGVIGSSIGAGASLAGGIAGTAMQNSANKRLRK